MVWFVSIKLSFIFLFALVVGCSHLRQPDIVKPERLVDFVRYEIKGREGFMPGSKIRFADYKGGRKQGWVNGHGSVLLPTIMINSTKSQESSITVDTASNQRLAINYVHSCSEKGIRIPINDLVEFDTVESSYHTSAILTYRNQAWELNDHQFRSEAGGVLRFDGQAVLIDEEVIAEVMIGAYLGGFKSADYVWFDVNATEQQRDLAAGMIVYSLSAEGVSCESE